MLSILIPIYNFDVTQLARDIMAQIDHLNEKVELICVDDHSTGGIQTQNEIALMSLGTRYEILEQNLGRSQIRNYMARKAQYDHLLFIDCDSEIDNENYIQKYLDHITLNQHSEVICGGTLYDNSPPAVDGLLHWNYGIQREAISAEQRSKHPAWHLHTNNLCIPKNVLLTHPFDETIEGYGYEDLVFGHELQHSGCAIIHIDNPVIHAGIKPFAEFITGIQQSSVTLSKLYTESKIDTTKLIRTYVYLKRCLVLNPVLFLIQSMEPYLLSHLRLHPKRIFLLDFLKLLYFAKAVKNS